MIAQVDTSVRSAAKVAGAVYLLALVPAVFAEFVARGSLIDTSDMAGTLANLATHESLFRLGIACNLGVFAGDIVLITALYLALRRVGPGLALLAAAWGLVETAVLVTATWSDFEALRLFANISALPTLGGPMRSALLQLSLSAHGDIYNVGLVFGGLRSMSFAALWWKSGYLPRVLAGFGLGAAALMGSRALAFVIAPELAQQVPVGVYGGPIFLFELVMGAWLVARPLRDTTLT